MNKIVYSLFAAALVVVSGCSDETVDNPVIPAQTGDEITFGSSLENVQTRTIYGDLEGNAYPVYWEDGDQISIYCPQAAQGNLVTYKVTPAEGDATHSSAVTKVNADEAGLQWGKEETHKFSAFYPANRILGVEDGKLKGEIPVEQNPVSWKTETNEAGGTTYTGVANTDYAFMWAYNEHDKADGSDVKLEFHPWVTILDVEINGPETETELKMSSVQLRSLTNETLNGEFLIDFNSVEDNPTAPNAAPTYVASGNTSATRSQITIQFYDKDLNNGQGDFITLKQNDKIMVRFYLLPKDANYDTSTGRTDLQLRVVPYNSAVLTRTLNAAGGTETGGILAHKVNKVILPSVQKTGPNYWMSSLNPAIYVTELSLPGSRMSSLTSANEASVIYQDQTISEQFQNGVRAFYFQTMYENDGGIGILEQPDYNLYLAVNGKKLERFQYYIKEIADGLQTAETAGKDQEFAFVLLTWSSIGGSSNGDRWMEAVEEELKEMSEDSQYRIYTDEITPQTTIDKVKGKIIVKVNYNDENMGNSLNSDAGVPALFAVWDKFYQPDGNPLRWGSSNTAVNTSMKWVYQEVTTVGDTSSPVGAQTSLADKKTYISQMFESSIEAYKNNSEHNLWFMNDCGGSLAGSVTGQWVSGTYGNGGENSQGVTDLTHELGLYVTQELQERTEDATLGIVYLNFANPDNAYSGNLIQTIINNNFSFQLRTDGSTQAETYNATYSNGGNAIGWEK